MRTAGKSWKRCRPAAQKTRSRSPCFESDAPNLGSSSRVESRHLRRHDEGPGVVMGPNLGSRSRVEGAPLRQVMRGAGGREGPRGDERFCMQHGGVGQQERWRVALSPESGEQQPLESNTESKTGREARHSSQRGGGHGLATVSVAARTRRSAMGEGERVRVRG